MTGDDIFIFGVISLIIAIIGLLLALTLMLNGRHRRHDCVDRPTTPTTPTPDESDEELPLEELEYEIDGVIVDYRTKIWYRGIGGKNPYDYVRYVKLSSFHFFANVNVPSPPMANYNFSHTPDNGVFPQWNTDMNQLIAFIKWGIQIEKYCNSGKASKETKALGYAIITDMLQEINTMIPRVAEAPTNYIFAVLIPQFCCLYALAYPTNSLISLAITIIGQCINEPGTLFGTALSNSYYSVCMAAPFIVTQNYLNLYDQASLSVSYLRALGDAQNDFTTTFYSNGLTADYGFSSRYSPLMWDFATTVSAPDYAILFQKYSDAWALYQIDNRVKSYTSVYETCANILLHPTIRATSFGLLYPYTSSLEYTPEMSDLIPTTNNYGLRIIPSVGYLRWFGADFAFCVRGQNSKLCAFLAGGDNANLLQYYTQYRDFTYANQQMTPIWPNCGFVNNVSDTGLKAATTTSGTDSVTQFVPSAGSRCGVFIVNDMGFFYQEYSLDVLGTYYVREMIVCIPETGSVTIHAVIENNSATDSYNYYYGRAPNIEALEVPPNYGCNITYIQMTNPATASIFANSTYQPIGTQTTWEISMDSIRYSIVTDDQIVGLSVNGTPSYIWPYNMTEFQTIYTYNDTPFVYSPTYNTYVLSDLLTTLSAENLSNARDTTLAKRRNDSSLGNSRTRTYTKTRNSSRRATKISH